jgi:hypothetical protein
MNKYANSTIYKIFCKDANVHDVYVGSTVNYKKRMTRHKSNCNNINSKAYNCFIYQFIRQNGNWDNFDHEIIENYNCNNKTELCIRERYWMEQHDSSLNSQRAYRTTDEALQQDLTCK